MSIKSQIERLSIQERRQLAHAFDLGISQHVIISGTNNFVAVHLVPERNKNLKIEEEIGVWSYGHVKGNKLQQTGE